MKDYSIETLKKLLEINRSETEVKNNIDIILHELEESDIQRDKIVSMLEETYKKYDEINSKGRNITTDESILRDELNEKAIDLKQELETQEKISEELYAKQEKEESKIIDFYKAKREIEERAKKEAEEENKVFYNGTVTVSKKIIAEYDEINVSKNSLAKVEGMDQVNTLNRIYRYIPNGYKFNVSDELKNTINKSSFINPENDLDESRVIYLEKVKKEKLANSIKEVLKEHGLTSQATINNDVELKPLVDVESNQDVKVEEPKVKEEDTEENKVQANLEVEKTEDKINDNVVSKEAPVEEKKEEATTTKENEENKVEEQKPIENNVVTEVPKLNLFENVVNSAPQESVLPTPIPTPTVEQPVVNETLVVNPEVPSPIENATETPQEDFMQQANMKLNKIASFDKVKEEKIKSIVKKEGYSTTIDDNKKITSIKNNDGSEIKSNSVTTSNVLNFPQMPAQNVEQNVVENTQGANLFAQAQDNILKKAI